MEHSFRRVWECEGGSHEHRLDLPKVRPCERAARVPVPVLRWWVPPRTSPATATVALEPATMAMGPALESAAVGSVRAAVAVAVVLASDNLQ